MATEKKAGFDTVWWVEHPDHSVAVVRAANWEQATVEAAKWWDVAWKTVAAMCECKKKEVLPKFCCCDCGDVFYGRDGQKTRCAVCEIKARDLENNKRPAGKRYWKEMQPRKEASV